MKTDPLTNPQPGDIVQGKSEIRKVTTRNGGDIRYFVVNQKNKVLKYCWITTWCDWCKNNDQGKPIAPMNEQ